MRVRAFRFGKLPTGFLLTKSSNWVGCHAAVVISRLWTLAPVQAAGDISVLASKGQAITVSIWHTSCSLGSNLSRTVSWKWRIVLMNCYICRPTKKWPQHWREGVPVLGLRQRLWAGLQRRWLTMLVLSRARFTGVNLGHIRSARNA